MTQLHFLSDSEMPIEPPKISPHESKYQRFKRAFLKKYWCKLNNKLCGSVESNDCKYEEKENDK